MSPRAARAPAEPDHLARPVRSSVTHPEVARPGMESGSELTRDVLVARLRAAGCVRAEDEADLLLAASGGAAGVGPLAGLLDRRIAGEPLEHVLGWAVLAGIRVRVSPGVFVPRARSALLVGTAARLLTRRHAPGDAAGPAAAGDPPVVVDLCSGTGALGLATVLRAGMPVRLHAADLDPSAVADAASNLAEVGGCAHLGDLFDALPLTLRGRVALILCNAPYVPSDRIALLPREAREHEALAALDGGPDGLTVHRRVLAQAPGWLAPGGSLLVEVHDSQVEVIRAAATAVRLSTRTARDRQERTTVVVATLPVREPATGR